MPSFTSLPYRWVGGNIVISSATEYYGIMEECKEQIAADVHDDYVVVGGMEECSGAYVENL